MENKVFYRLSFIVAVLVAKFAAGVVDTCGKFATGVDDNGSKFAAGVIDTSGPPWLVNISVNFKGEDKSWKKS